MRFHDTLNSLIWDLETNDMLPEVKEKLKEIAEAFIEFLEIPTDAVLDKVITGSSASYNYNKYSDLDLHIIVDYDKVHEDCPLVNGYLNSLKKQFNDNHDITIHGVPVELYAEQKDQGTVHNGLYSLNTGWIDKPQKIAPTDNDAAVEAKYQEIKELVDKCDDSEEATELLEKIYNMRKAGLAEAGEFCTENLAFKKLRNEGCMDKLRQIKKEQIDKQLSLESYNEAVDSIVIDNYLKMLLDGGHVVDTPDSQYIVQVFTNKKLQKLVEFDDIRKAAETFIEFTDIYTKDEDVVLFKQMRDNGKDIKTIDSTWLNVSNKNESIHKLNRTINKAIGEDTLGEKNYIIPCDTIEEAVNVIKVIWGQHFVDISNKYHPNKELIGGIYRMEKTTGDSEGSAYLLGYFDAQNKRLHVYTKVRHGEHMSGRPKNYDYLRNTLKPNYKELNNFTQKFKEAIGEDMEKEPVYHYSVEDIDKQGNDFDNAEEAYEQAQKDLTALGYEVKELNDDGEFEIVSTSTGVAYTGVIYPSNPELDESLEWEICRDMEAGYFYICNDEEIYCDPDGEPYHFDTREAAEEFLHSLNEDAATLEKKMDVAQDTLNDLLKSITDVREDFDLDKAYNLINEALKED